MDFLTVLPNLSIGVVSIGALVYISIKFLDRLKEKDEESLQQQELMLGEIKEREQAFRELEKSVRDTILTQLAENTRVMERANINLQRNEQ